MSFILNFRLTKHRRQSIYYNINFIRWYFDCWIWEERTGKIPNNAVFFDSVSLPPLHTVVTTHRLQQMSMNGDDILPPPHRGCVMMTPTSTHGRREGVWHCDNDTTVASKDKLTDSHGKLRPSHVTRPLRYFGNISRVCHKLSSALGGFSPFNPCLAAILWQLKPCYQMLSKFWLILDYLLLGAHMPLYTILWTCLTEVVKKLIYSRKQTPTQIYILISKNVWTLESRILKNQ